MDSNLAGLKRGMVAAVASSAGLMRRRLAAAAAAERASLDLLAQRDLPESILGELSSALTMRNRARGWIHSPEVDLLDFEGTEINGGELVKLARARFAARMERKRIGRARYERRHGCVQRDFTWRRGMSAGEILGTRPTGIILDDPHAEQSPEQRAATIAWYEDRAPR